MSEKEYGTFGPAVDAENFFTNRVYYEDGIDAVSSKEYSRYVSELMDRLGYSYEMIKHRQHMYKELDNLFNGHENSAYTRITTGGKDEGTTLFYESDFDHMCIKDNVICADNPHQFVNVDSVTLFQTETQETSPGYTRLKAVWRRRGENVIEEEIANSLLCDENDECYLSSKRFIDAMKPRRRQAYLRQGWTSEPTSGPSSPASNGYTSQDNVDCFRCVCPNIIERWVSRLRKWPSPETVHEIALLDGHVVPVGFKGSQNMFIEWRICYTPAELHLMRHLNEAQLKVYILLKKICKSVLNRVCNDMTSYIMKNIVLWVCERNGVGAFTREMIMDRLYDCIQFLKKCLCENNLPSYMIPERNLLAGRVDTQQKQQLTSVLNDLLQERGRMLLRCVKLRDAMFMMYKTPNMLRECSEKRDKVERLVLMNNIIEERSRKLGMSSEEQEQLNAQNIPYCFGKALVIRVMQFDIEELRQMGKTDDEIGELCVEKQVQLLS